MIEDDLEENHHDGETKEKLETNKIMKKTKKKRLEVRRTEKSILISENNNNKKTENIKTEKSLEY